MEMMRAAECHKQGYNCAEAIFKSINENKKLDIPVEIGSALGGGMCVGSTCGAVTAGAVVIGYLKGRHNSAETNQARDLTRCFMQAVKEKYGTNLCVELKKKGVTCTEIINYVEEYLQRELK